MPVRNLRDATIVIADDGGSAGDDKITLVLEEGNLSWTEARPVDIISSRGALHHARQGNEVPVEFSMTLKFQTFRDPNSSDVTPYEAVTGTGSASGWTSDASNGGDAYACIIEATFSDPAGGSDEVVTFTESYVESIQFAESSPHNTLTLSGRALITAPAVS